MYKFFIRPFFFLLDPESAHRIVVGLLSLFLGNSWARSLVRKSYHTDSRPIQQKLFGLKFPNPVGLAAGFDKDAEMVDALDAFGFGFIEVGTITPKPQPGNEKPRLFRLPKDKGLINRMGFNNKGVDAAVERLKKRRSKIIVGGNIGKNKNTPNELAHRDYEYCLEKMYDVVDYFVVNVSSPNTPDLRQLQSKEPLKKLLGKLIDKMHQKENLKPLLLKIAPDLTPKELDDIIEIVTDLNLSGLIISNTTIDREGLKTGRKRINKMGPGGLSGKPVREKSTRMIKYCRERLGKTFPIIGVGGIFDTEDAKEKMKAGANLVQVYTGFIYEGPSMVKNIIRGLVVNSN